MAIFTWFFITAISFAIAADCSDPLAVQKKINQLKLETTCSSVSLHECGSLLKSFHDDHAVVQDLSQGERCDLDLNPLTRPVIKLAKTMAEHELMSGPNAHVNSIEEFFEHTRLHRERVKLMGMELFRTHPELFKGLTHAQVLHILEAHDRAKISTRYLAPSGRPFYRELYQYYGKKMPADLVQSLNAADAKHMEDAYKLAGLHDDARMTAGERARRAALKNQLKLIESVADLVDRGASPVAAEEFGRPLKAGSTFLKNQTAKKLALELERSYPRLTTNLEFRPLTLPQKARVLRQLARNQAYASALKKRGLYALSVRALGYSAIQRGKSGLFKLMGKLSTPLAKKILFSVDLIGLYFADMEQLGCDGIGYHDWVKNPNCQPAIGLTPKVLQFLNEDPETQLHYLKTQPGTCKVITETYKQSIAIPKIRSCKPSALELELAEGKVVRIELDSKKRMKKVDLGKFGSDLTGIFRGPSENVEISPEGNVSKVCYKVMGKNPVRTCVNREKEPSEEILKHEGFLKSINFQVQKAIASCL